MTRSIRPPAALAAVLALLVAAPAAAQDPVAIADRADRVLADLSTLRAEFVQRVENPVLERTTTGRGTLVYRAPDRFRIAYDDPAGDVVVNDGRRVWIYLPSSQPGQVIRQSAETSGVRNPLTFLRDLRGHYTTRHVGVEEVAGRSSDHLALAPVDRGAPFERLDVWVDRATGLPRQVRTRTADDIVTTYTFRSLTPGAPVAADAFAFHAPRGVEVFDQ